MMSTLKEERDRVVALLGTDAPTLAAMDLPDAPGIYALWACTEQTCTDLGLEEVEGEAPLVHRPLYIGKAQASLWKRVAKKHMASGDTGHSTVRRTFGALLDLRSRPRRSKLDSPTPMQLRILSTSYDLVREDDDKLTDWMTTCLLIRATNSDWEPLGELERAVGAVLRPPLDQERSPMWQPSPWRPHVSAARERLRLRARGE